jgi:hypothetical protein
MHVASIIIRTASNASRAKALALPQPTRNILETDASAVLNHQIVEGVEASLELYQEVRMAYFQASSPIC